MRGRAPDALSGSAFTIATRLPSRSPAVAIDAGALEAVLTTLAENARQAGAGRLDIALSAGQGTVRIDLADDGPGIPETDRARVFEPFFTSKREQGGTGLGLSIARSLLQAYGGELDLIASPTGAHFRLSCPDITG